MTGWALFVALVVGSLWLGVVVYFAVAFALNDHVDRLVRAVENAADKIVRAGKAA